MVAALSSVRTDQPGRKGAPALDRVIVVGLVVVARFLGDGGAARGKQEGGKEKQAGGHGCAHVAFLGR